MPEMNIDEAIKEVDKDKFTKNWFMSVQEHEQEKLEQESQAKMQMADLLGKVQARDKALKIFSQRLDKMRTRLITAYIAAAFGIGGAVASVLLQVLK